MKITFLGSGHGVPSADRFCSCAMIEVGNSLYFIDGGVPVVDLILRYGYKVEDVKAVFTTHAHGDHINGIIGLADLVNWYYKNASIDFYMTEEKPTKAIIDYLEATVNRPISNDRVRFSIYDESFVYEDENIKVTPFTTEHLNYINSHRPSFGFVVEAEGKRVVFSGDLSVHLKHNDFPSIATSEPVDVLICEMAHFSPDEVMPYMDKCTAKEVWFNHVYPLSNIERINQMNEKYNFAVKAACDGDVIEL